MNANAAIQHSLKSTKNILHMFLDDLSDADLLVRPVQAANHIAWQLGHLILSESGMLKKNFTDIPAPTLPPGFEEQHNKEAAAKDTGFLPKNVYLDLFDKIRDANIAFAGKVSEADLDKPSGWDFAPTLGGFLLLNADHVMMHAGQFTVVRRKLGKPVLF